MYCSFGEQTIENNQSQLVSSYIKFLFDYPDKNSIDWIHIIINFICYWEPK